MSRSPRRRDERGVSAVELALYMPILLVVIFVAVQFTLVYLGNQAAGAVAREAARTARVSGSAGAGQARGYQYAASISKGMLNGVRVTVTQVGADRMRATVTGQAQRLSPIGVPQVSQTVEGPIEQFVQEQP